MSTIDYCGTTADDQVTLELLPIETTTLDTIVVIGGNYNGIVINRDTTILEPL
ncbi:hypothetical protein HC928_15285 [bacterium]|nr:hypothetical protein [bacterium]